MKHPRSSSDLPEIHPVAPECYSEVLPQDASFLRDWTGEITVYMECLPLLYEARCRASCPWLARPEPERTNLGSELALGPRETRHFIATAVIPFQSSHAPPLSFAS